MAKGAQAKQEIFDKIQHLRGEKCSSALAPWTLIQKESG